MTDYWKYGGKQFVENRTAQSEEETEPQAVEREL
jgi:hypothetical protein